MSEQNKDPRNTGHGWVVERPDGMKAKCGGPGLCAECKADQEAIDPPRTGVEPDPLRWLVDVDGYRAVYCETLDIANGTLRHYSDRGRKVELIELIDRAHVARLQAEVERLTKTDEAYDDAMNASNELGYACMSAGDVIRHQADEAVQLKARNAELEGLLRDLVIINEQHNEAVAKVIGKPMGWKDSYLDAARAALAEGKEHE